MPLVMRKFSVQKCIYDLQRQARSYHSSAKSQNICVIMLSCGFCAETICTQSRPYSFHLISCYRNTDSCSADQDSFLAFPILDRSSHFSGIYGIVHRFGTVTPEILIWNLLLLQILYDLLFQFKPSRVESEDDQTLVIVDVPVAERQDEEKTVVYSTIPMAIITNNRFITTVCLRENAVVNEISQGLVKNIQTHLRTQFLLNILLRIATRFLQYLKQIDKISYTTENLLQKTMRNKELIQILGLEKSLVYFSTSLKSNEVTLEKILRGRIIKLYDEDEDLLEDVIIEVKQAIEMCSIYSNVLSNTMDAFSSIINNNLNIVM